MLTYYKEFASEKAEDEAGRARTATAAMRVGVIEYRLGRKEEAAAAIRLALDGYETLAADFPAVPAYRQESGRKPQQPGGSAGTTWGSGRRRSSSTARP